MSFIQLLADVELQLIMHGLSRHDLLHFARCSHRLLHAADAPFAWTHLPAFLYFRDLPVRPTVASVASRSGVFSRAPLTVRWIYARRFVSRSLEHFDSFRHLHMLDLSFERHFRTQICDHFMHPSMQHLRVLRLRRCRTGWKLVNNEVLGLIAALPLLHTLDLSLESAFFPSARLDHARSMRTLKSFFADRLDGGQVALGNPSSSSSSSLLQPDSSPTVTVTPPALTFLRVTDTDGWTKRSVISFATQCTKLRQLHLVLPSLYGSSFLAFFSAPNMRQLQSLTLDYFFASGFNKCEHVSSKDYALAFAALVELHTLHLDHVMNVDAMLPGLAHAPALRRLFIQPGCEMHDVQRCTKVPSMDALVQLMLAVPSLECTLQLPYRHRHAGNHPGATVGYKASMQALVGSRFNVERSLAVSMAVGTTGL